ncbi:hypothetical protein ACGFNU_21365 [Spirillospora sp. NPDC048911]|uniref:hypothetical protein n=1 Tax=Spirillospora sp. NPDC048911 TaxID=3364527 RepID=UPI003721FD0F
MANQADLDAIVARIDTALTGIRQDIQDLKDQAPPELDFSALEAKVAALEGLDAENPAAEQPGPGTGDDTGTSTETPGTNTGDTGGTTFGR